ncbi:MAG: nitrate ABC transporter substrate-binding protein [Holophaga sp.]|jgi:4,5-dihydroxyphthalate decarboxylase
MKVSVKLATRDWATVMPLALGEVRPKDFDLEIVRLPGVPDDLTGCDAGEVSFSRYALWRAAGEDVVTGTPHFLMRVFRHRCILTTRDSGLTAIAQLKGRRIGLTGWHDSGNVWTRALLRREGIGVDDAEWFVGRVGEDEKPGDRLGRHGRPGRISAVPGDRPLLEWLANGKLDAVFAPFMPPALFTARSWLRQLIPDCRGAELAYFRQTGYVPGIHILGVRPALAREHPWLPRALSELLDQSTRAWLEKQQRYADTTLPWAALELARAAQDLPESWNRNGLEPNRAMIADFAAELHAQDLTPRRLTPEELFPAAW